MRAASTAYSCGNSIRRNDLANRQAPECRNRSVGRLHFVCAGENVPLIAQSINLARILWHQRWPREKLRRAQNSAFVNLFRHAYDKIPFYSNLYSSHGLSRDDVQSLDDITKLPIVDKHALRAAAEAGDIWQGDEAHQPIRTSGSTGAPFSFRIDPSDNRWRKAQYLAPYLLSGRKPLETALRFYWGPVGTRAWYRRLGIFREIYARADAPEAEQYARLLETRPDYLQGYPSMLHLLARHILDHGLISPPLKAVFSDSEILALETRRLVERAFNTRVVDVFGSYETDNIGFECRMHDGLHILEDCVYVEAMPNQGIGIGGDSGELICTVLRSRLTPFIRYNLGDLVRIEASPCGCGRVSPRLIVLGGRSNDLINLPNGGRRSAMSLIQQCRDAISNSALEFQIRQVSGTGFELCVVAKPNFGPTDRAAIENIFEKSLPGAAVAIRNVDKIERTAAGKYRVFVGINRDGD